MFAIPRFRSVVISKFSFIQFTLAKAKNIVRYTDDLYRDSLNRGSTVGEEDFLSSYRIAIS